VVYLVALAFAGVVISGRSFESFQLTSVSFILILHDNALDVARHLLELP
jgi:hypothetical protein